MPASRGGHDDRVGISIGASFSIVMPGRPEAEPGIHGFLVLVGRIANDQMRSWEPSNRAPMKTGSVDYFFGALAGLLAAARRLGLCTARTLPLPPPPQ